MSEPVSQTTTSSHNGQVAVAVDETGLLSRHISTQAEYFSELRVWLDGNVVELEFDTHVQEPKTEGFSPVDEMPARPLELRMRDEAKRDHDRENREYDGGIRGKPEPGLSQKARRRLLLTANKLHKGYRPLFLTLTYADHFVCDWQVWKNNLEAFRKRLERRFGACPTIWRMEMKTRKSGENVGQVAPHFHLLVFVPHAARRPNWKYSERWLQRFRPWLAQAWADIVGYSKMDGKATKNGWKSFYRLHLEAGTSCDPILDDRGVVTYVGKYIAKVDEQAALAQYPQGVGRVWGVWHEKSLPWSEVAKLLLNRYEAAAVMRFMRFILGIEHDKAYPSLRCFLQPHDFLEHLDSIVDTFS